MKLLEILFPRKCILCRNLLSSEDEVLCPVCQGNSPRILPDSGQKLTFHFLDSYTAVWYYQGYVRKAILRYKFYRGFYLASGFAQLMSEAVRNSSMGPFDLVTWVPVSRRRKWSRGYDQAQLLAKGIGKRLNLPTIRCLQKVHHNTAQSSLSGDERKGNVLGVYRGVHSECFCGKRVLLIDDIVTTGATAEECAKMLKICGAEYVALASIAAAEKKKEKKTKNV